MITSQSNSRIKNIIQLREKKKERDLQKAFVAEGVRMFSETPRERILKVFLSESFIRKNGEREELEGLDVEVVEDGVFAKASGTVSPQGILCIVSQREEKESLFTDPGGIYILLEALQDPGNLGTILRTAEGAGAAGVIMDRETVDVYSPKVVRSTMGSVYRVPFLRTSSLEEPVREMKQKGIAVYAAHLKGTREYTEPDYSAGTAFLIGNEGAGLSREAVSLADNLVRIPMEGRVESLNASVAAALLMYEAMGQRRRKS